MDQPITTQGIVLTLHFTFDPELEKIGNQVMKPFTNLINAELISKRFICQLGELINFASDKQGPSECTKI